MVGQNLGAGLHPREDDQPPCLGEGASDWDDDGEEAGEEEEEEEDLACLANRRWILLKYIRKVITYNYRCSFIINQSLHTSGIVSLSVVKAMWGVWWPVVVVSGWKVILHKPWREASKIVWWWGGLVEWRWLLVGREGPSEMWRSL